MKKVPSGRRAGKMAEMVNAYLEAVGRIQDTVPFYGGSAPPREDQQKPAENPADADDFYQTFFDSEEFLRYADSKTKMPGGMKQAGAVFEDTSGLIFDYSPPPAELNIDGVVMEIEEDPEFFDSEYPEFWDEGDESDEKGEMRDSPTDDTTEAEPGDTIDEDPYPLALHQLNQRM